MPIEPVALQIKPPEGDISKPLNALAQWQMSLAHSRLYGQQARLQEMKIGALQDYVKAAQTGDHGAILDSINRVAAADPEAANQLQKLHQGTRQIKAQDTFGATGDPAAVAAFPDVYAHVQTALSTRDENQRKQAGFRFTTGGQQMGAYLRAPSTKTWNDSLDEMVKSGAYTKQELMPYYNNPNQLQATRFQYAGQVAKDQMETSGTAAGNKPVGIGPTENIVVPNQLQPGGQPQVPGAPPGSMMPGGEQFLTPGTPPAPPGPPAAPPPAPSVPSAGPPGTPVPPTVPPPTGTPVPGAPPVAPGPTAPAPTAPAPTGPPKTKDQTDLENDPVYKEVPKVDIGQNEPMQPGQLWRGQNPTVMAAKTESIDHYKKEIQPAADASVKQKAELGTVISLMEKGTLPTSRIAGIQETAAALIYSVTKNLDMANDLTGMKLTDAEMMNKVSTKLGFDMARTQGAREAVQVIQFAFAANPNLKNSKEGNLMVAKMLDQMAQYNIDRANYAGKYMIKNAGHLIDFDNWFNKNHSIETYTSKVVPYRLPGDPSELKPGVTYGWAEDAGEGKKPKEMKGIWDPDQNGFKPVK